MRLISVRIENFGKLHDFDLTLENGKNVILHDNGYGKTTLATFIKVMFYGFDDEGARKAVRERDKYKPWQGGVYGGTIKFEAGGKDYILRRTFGDKPANDELELRDAATNLISTDYTNNIGEELFLLDAESFKKAMYIGQNSVMTSTTDKINSHVTTGAEALEDLGGFDRAIKTIEDRQNALSERRKTGELYKKKEELSSLEHELTKATSLNQSYGDLCAKISECKSAIGRLKTEEDNLYAKQKEISRKKDLAALKKEYDLLTGAVTATENKVKEYKAEFKGRIVSEAEVETMLNRNSDLISAESAADAHKLGTEELRRLDELKAAISQEMGEPEIGQAPMYRKPIVEIVGMVFAVLEMAAAIAIMILYHNYVVGGLLAGSGLVMLVCLIMLIFARKNKYNMAVTTWQAEVAAQKKRLEDLRHLNEMEYDRLSSKKAEYESKSAEALKVREEIAEFLASAGMVAEANPMPQLLSLQDLIEDYGHALEAYEEAGKKLESFIKNTSDIEEVKACTAIESADELTGINIRLKEIDIEEEEIKANLKIYDGNMEELNELFEGIEDAKNRRDALSEEITAGKKEAIILEKTGEYLQKAKSSFISRYTAPVLDAFKKYYGMLGSDKEKFLLDANINITKEEEGAQREIEALSSGNRDLVGLALRMAFVSAMTKKEQPFIIMDDPFVNFDTARVEAAKHFLDEVAKEYQVIYLTCYDKRA